MNEFYNFRCPSCKNKSLKFSQKNKKWRCFNLECEAEFKVDEHKVFTLCPKCSSENLKFYPIDKIWMCENSECKVEYSDDYIRHVHYGLDIHLLPAVIAIPIREYLDEKNPITRLYRLCISLELVVKFLTIICLSKILLHVKKEEILNNLIEQIKWEIITPTLGKWASILSKCTKSLDELSIDSNLVRFMQEITLPLIGSGRGEVSKEILAVRNLMFHRGFSNIEAEDILQNYEPEILQAEEDLLIIKFWKGLKIFENSKLLIVREKDFGQLMGFETEIKEIISISSINKNLENYKSLIGHILLVYNNEILDLWPIYTYLKPKAFKGFEEKKFSTESPMLYSKFLRVKILYQAIGIDLGTGEEASEDSLKKFREFFNLEKDDKEVLDFENDIFRDWSLAIGRTNEIAKAKKLIKKTRRAEPQITRNHFLWISGSPGIGKTILMAILAKDLLGDTEKQLRLAYRFKAGDFRCSREKFMQYCIDRMNEYLNKHYKKESDPKKLLLNFDILLKEFAKFEPKDTRTLPKQLLIFIDGLDEILEIDPEFIHIILNRPYINVYWILAGRSEKNIPNYLNDSTCIQIFGSEGLNKMSKSDIRSMLLSDTGEKALNLLLRDEETDKKELKNKFIEEVWEKSDGLPLYVYYLIDEINKGNLTFNDERFLPEGLTDYYNKNLNRMGIGDLTNILTPLIVLISWTEEPLNESILRHFLIKKKVLDESNESMKILSNALIMLKSLLKITINSEGDYWYSLYHESFRTYIQESLELKVSNKLILDLYAKAILDIESIPFGSIRDFISRYSSYYLILAKKKFKQMGDKFKFSNKKEEIKVLRNASKGLINLYNNFKAEYHKHRNEIIPICKWLKKLNQYDAIIELVDNILKILENQCLWPILDNILHHGLESLHALEKLTLEDLRREITYKFKRANVLYHQAYYQKSVELAQESLKLAEESGFKTIEADILWHLGQVSRYLGEKQLALKYLEKAEKMSNQIEYHTNLARIMVTRAIIEHGSGNIEGALEYYKKCEIIENTLDDKQSIGERMLDMLRIKGGLRYDQGLYDQAYAIWSQMETLAKEMNSEHWRIIAKARLSLVDQEMDLDTMKTVWLDSLNINLSAGEIASAATSYGELAEVCIRRKEFIEAIELCEKGKVLIEESGIDNPHTRSVNAYLDGIILLAKNEIDQARAKLEHAARLFEVWTTPYRFWVKDTLKRLNYDD